MDISDKNYDEECEINFLNRVLNQNKQVAFNILLKIIWGLFKN
jgi:hypothetical protein